MLRGCFIRFRQVNFRPLCTSVPDLELDVAINSLEGRTKKNEDRCHFQTFDKNIVYFGIFDGHNGSFVSNFVNKNLPKVIKKEINNERYSLYDDVGGTMETVFFRSFDICQQMIQETLHSIENIPRRDMVGSTAVVGILIDRKYLSFANVGDSKAILCRNGSPVELSIEHNPSNQEEVKRIIESGGNIDWDSRFRPLVDSRLSMTRSFGNLLLKSKGVISEPSVKHETINDLTDSFVVLCSDGITHAMTNNEICYIIGQHDNANDAAEDLASTAQQYGSIDDCTCLIVPFYAWRTIDVKMPNTNYGAFRTFVGGRSDG